MRKFVLALAVALAAALAHTQVWSGDAFDFGALPPLPPPLLDDSPAAPSLAPPESGARSPLVQPAGTTAAAPASAGFGASAPLTPPAAALPAAVPDAMPSPLAPPSVPPLAPPPPGPESASGGLVPPAAPPIAPPPADGSSGSPSPGLPDSLGGLEPLPAAVSAAPAEPETPRTAKISGGRVNVRAGPNTQYESIAVLTTGTPVTVLARNGDWYKIIYPAEQLASIHKNYVNADIAGEIPEAGLPGVVSQDNADVHAYYWDKSTIVGKLNKGDPVTIKQERGQWYRIDAPPSARAYVFAEYVRVDGSEPVVADSAPLPESSVDLSAGRAGPDGGVKLSADDQKAIDQKTAYYESLRRRQADEEEQARNQVNRLEQALDDFEARLRAIDEQSGASTYYSMGTTSLGSAAWAPPDPAYGGYYGWVENIGRVGGAPASFRLSKGGEVRFYLRSDRYGLNDFVGRRVWVNGNVELASGAIASVLNVDQIRILTDQEIAESMRQQQEAAGILPAPTPQPLELGDPYASYYESDGDPYSSYQPAPGGYLQPTEIIPADPGQLPDVVGAGQTGFPTAMPPVTSSRGEVDSSYYQQPAISEIAP